MALAAYDAADRAAQLLAVTRRLTELVQEEIDGLDDGRIDSSRDSWAEKERLAHAYRLEMLRIGKDPSLLAGIVPEIKETLKQAVSRFQTILADHARALGVVKDVTENLVRSVCREVAAGQAAPPCYGTDGQDKAAHHLGSGVALDATA